MIESMPLPATDDPIDAEYWAAALRGDLVVQRCGDCAERRFPPRAMCPRCRSLRVTWEPLSGCGRIWSYAQPQPPLLPAFTALLPYVTAVVELEEEARLRIVGPLLRAAETVSGLHHAVAAMRGVDGAEVAIGAPVRIAFLRCADDVALPCWQLC